MLQQGPEKLMASPAISRRPWFRAVLVIPAAVLPVLPNATCPVCLAAYAGVFSALGLGFLFDARVQGPLILVFLGITITSVGSTVRRRRRIGPLVIVLIGSLAILAARLVWYLPIFIYGGIAFLIAGTLWNLAVKRPRKQVVLLSSS